VTAGHSPRRLALSASGNQSLAPHLLHHLCPLLLDRRLTGAELAAICLFRRPVMILCMTSRSAASESHIDASARPISCVPLAPRGPFDRVTDRLQQSRCVQRFSEKLHRPALHCTHCHWMSPRPVRKITGRARSVPASSFCRSSPLSPEGARRARDSPACRAGRKRENPARC